MSVSLEEREMLWEHEPQASVSTAFLSSPKLSRVFLKLDRNTKKMFLLREVPGSIFSDFNVCFDFPRVRVAIALNTRKTEH